MSLIQAIILGIVQGITEFLPVSSSGHLTLFQSLFGIENLDQFIAFDLICHLGTLCVIFIVFLHEIRNVIKNDKRKLWLIIIGTLPLFPVILILKPLKSLYNQPQYLGFFFLITTIVLYVGVRFGQSLSTETLKKKNRNDALTIGFFQTLALLPGVSRSGSTISSARVLGWSPKEAVQFSFLLSIPAILGGSILEALQIYSGTCQICNLNWQHYFLGFIFSFIFGLASLMLLIKLALKNRFMFFVWYTFFLGLFSLVYFSF